MTIGINRRTLSAGTLVGDDIITRSGEKLGTVKEIMLDLGIREMTLFTNNPKNVVGLEGYGLYIAGYKSL